MSFESGCSAECESVGLNSRIQELNCERAITYHIVLSDKLIQTLAVDDALTIRIGVGAVIRARCISVNDDDNDSGSRGRCTYYCRPF